MMFSGTIWNPVGVLLTFVLQPVLSEISKPVVVNLGDTTVLNCNSTCNRELLWTFKPNSENLQVLKCVQGNCTEGDGFKRRAEIKHGTSLTLHPSLYNDEGWYESRCDSEILCTVHLDVLVPTSVNASVQHNVTLPCYARTEKLMADDAMKILWKKDREPFLEVKNGHTSYGSGFTKRASVSLNDYRDGDLSLSISMVTLSDSGLYQCYYETEEPGHPGAITLTVTAHRSIIERQVGDNLTLDVMNSEQVTVTFINSEGVGMLVCSVEGRTSSCDPKYKHRVFVVNASLVLSGLTSADSGTFTLQDNMGNIMSVCTVTVKDVAEIYSRRAVLTVILLPILFIICVALAGLILWYLCYRKPQQQQRNWPFNSQQSTVDIETIPLREPAKIGLSQEETGHDVQEQPDIPHTPVEETSPEIVMPTEKKDTLFLE
ncbi:uncharacterized protein si:dkey-22i16.9 [Triplophysa dalaica]|uniref:uncharacterized protein si:dkey-22i16.9 n=1 Tax=Triplophysa dalaica TaxID=1582913 RepID=UPI0024DF447B|nr:uncharacterized protein si:dkey-22i16.9 [Triplophysa dalaica]XP_056586780.1 uncharacterized protein si:dkey-22i16.9 [Triplophysa dalaica]XP_056586790.1 uncharacterized protein si:dkey-22i16.9 [Triplophysa dalaica]XP_056586799.1 uncharacterized protein si:dkey-22i16.9 [Triplophysa dalaica]XP_056586808.1 uncharacterized protein si:dkey-22i16.9 [Triplophysa dalaica]XP_056586817.1 uncharacterized protein si:dkey-22i16.9 [Triplophysa dalaica]